MIITVHCMQLSTPHSTTTASFILLVSLCLSSVSAQKHHLPPRFANDTESICRPFGECEPCPHEVMREPFCQPFGNRRLLHSVDDTSGFYTGDANSRHRHSNMELLPGETVAWESCGRIVVQERADFWEFVACNLVFVCIALGLVFVRSKRMNAMLARQLAARIGLARGYG
ncbi:hypothetical protein BJV78DRAFT_1373136 [Lactifluus subvellereus]|nr:hypothetical protein BJV78DRAFT_1373136 [Lactifluus subvellereus]